MNIDLIHWILVLLGGDLYQEYLIFSIWKPLWRKTWEEYIEPCCAKAPWKSQGARKWIKDIYIYLMMFWLCLITCEYVQHAFLIIIGYTLTRPFCTNIKCSFTLKKLYLLYYFVIVISFYSTVVEVWWTLSYTFPNLFCHKF